MRAVVLVGGFGTRLRPLTWQIPKPLLPVANVRILEHVLASLSRAGVTEATLALGFKPEPFFDAFPDGECAGIRLHYAVEPEPMDTAGAIGFAARATGIDDTFIVVNGDVLTDLDVGGLVGFHRASGAEGTIHLIEVEDPSQYGVVERNDDGTVVRFVEKPTPEQSRSRAVNAGTYVLEASVLGRIPEGIPLSVERVVFPAMAAEGRLSAMCTDDYWIDTGRPDTYLAANLDLIDGRRRTILAAVAAQATVSASASVTHSVIGDGASVDDGAIVVDSVLLPGARVGRSARVDVSIVAGSVGDGAHVASCVVGAEGRVEPGAELHGIKVPDPEAADPRR
jgi:mannose-1-phosphate guanylyltransferase